MAEQIRVLIVDDDPDRRAGLRRQVGSAGLVLAGEADFGGEAAYLAREAQPDVIAVSVEEPLARPLKTIELLASIASGAPVVALSSLGEKEHVRKSMLAGARDFVSRSANGEELVTALMAVVEVEQKRRSLAEEGLENGHKGEVIAVFSGKGGTGKTTIAANLAAALALDTIKKQKVVLIDLDLLLGDVAVTLDLVPERTFADVVPVIDKLDTELMRGLLSVHSSGVRVLAAPLRPEDAEVVEAPHVRKVLEVLARTHDFVIVDVPRSLADWAVIALDTATIVLLVTSYELSCLKSTRVCIDLMKKWRYSEDKLKLVVNHANRVNGYSVGEADSALDYPIFWKIPSEPGGLGPLINGLTLPQAQPHGRAAQNFRDLGAAVGGAHVRRNGVFSRIFS